MYVCIYIYVCVYIYIYIFIIYIYLMWVKKYHKPAMSLNGNHSTSKKMVIWRMDITIFSHMTWYLYMVS